MPAAACSGSTIPSSAASFCRTRRLFSRATQRRPRSSRACRSAPATTQVFGEWLGHSPEELAAFKAAGVSPEPALLPAVIVARFDEPTGERTREQARCSMSCDDCHVLGWGLSARAGTGDAGCTGARRAAASPPQTRAQQLMGDIAPKLAELTDNVLFGDVWARPGLSQRDRSLVTVSALIAMNRPDRSIPHRTGASKRRHGRGDRRDHHASGVLRRLAKCDQCGGRCERGFREVRQIFLMITRRRMLAASGGVARIRGGGQACCRAGRKEGNDEDHTQQFATVTKGPAEHFTGSVRVDTPFRGTSPRAPAEASSRLIRARARPGTRIRSARR